MSTTRMEIGGVYDTGCTVRVNAGRHDEDTRNFDAFATVGIQSGAAHLQTYLTPAECEELASMLMLAAKEVRELVAESEAAA